MCILAVLGAVAVPMAGNYVADSRALVTRQSLTRLRDVIAETYWQDNDRRLPERDSTVPPDPATRLTTPQLRYLFFNPHTNPESIAVTFDPAYRRGWRGPYVINRGGTTYTIDVAAGFSNLYGEDGDPAVPDGWGRPIVIQNPCLIDGVLDVRLVSAGADGEIDIDPTISSDAVRATPGAAGDDVWLSFEVRP